MINEMIAIHNCLLRSINAIYLQCINIEKSPQDIPDFVEYSLVWGEVIREHHSSEESEVFPDIEQRAGVAGLMAGNIEQHHTFHDGVEQYEAYLQDVKAGKEKYDGQKLKEIIDSFAPTLHQHLKDEIPTLSSLKKYSDKVDWGAYWSKKSAEIVKKASTSHEAKVSVKASTHIQFMLTNFLSFKTVFMPFCLSCHDPTFEESIISWPAMPWIAKMLFKWYYTPQHKSWWRFGPVNANGQRQELLFA